MRLVAFLGDFFKREGRPSEAETLTSRLIDRPIASTIPQRIHERSANRCNSDVN